MMFSIIEHIEYLMSCHDCVVVPGWGAFIANYSVADYDALRSVYGRPQRSIGFNAGVTHNDEESMRFIADSVTAFGKQLSIGSEVSMGRLGYFVRREGRYNEFVPFVNDNAGNHYYGLVDVEVRTVTALERALRDESNADASEAKHVERGLLPVVPRGLRPRLPCCWAWAYCSRHLSLWTVSTLTWQA